jgi:hypothetical protein
MNFCLGNGSNGTVAPKAQVPKGSSRKSVPIGLYQTHLRKSTAARRRPGREGDGKGKGDEIRISGWVQGKLKSYLSSVGLI